MYENESLEFVVQIFEMSISKIRSYVQHQKISLQQNS